MRNLILAVLALASWTTHALTISVDADLLKNADGSPMPMTGLVVLVASTTDSTFNAPSSGSFVSGDDIVLAKFDLQKATNGVLLDIVNGLTFSGSWNQGDPFAIYWYPTLNINSAAPSGGIPYGFFTTISVPVGDDPWVTPGQGATINLRMITTDANSDYHLDGTISPSAGLANLVVAGAPTPPQLAVSLNGGNNVNIHLTGTANQNYALQYVNALLNVGTPWQSIVTNKADTNGVIDFSDAIGAGSRFYRGKLVP
jgi:hypothetical protein